MERGVSVGEDVVGILHVFGGGDECVGGEVGGKPW